MATTNTDKVQEAYIAYYGRPADPGGLTYWVGQLDKGVTFDVMLRAFGTSVEATTLFGNKTNEDTVKTLFQQILGRTPDIGGSAFYAGRLKDGSMTGITIAQNVFDGATGNDATIVANKLAVAKAFNTSLNTTEKKAAYAGAEAVVTLRKMLATVDNLTDVATFDVATIVNGLLASVAANLNYQHLINVIKGELTTAEEIAASDKITQAAIDAATTAGATIAEVISAYHNRVNTGFDAAVAAHAATVVTHTEAAITAAASTAAATTATNALAAATGATALALLSSVA